MTALKADNRRLEQTVSELRTERRAQERRIRDLQRQLDLARAQLATGEGGGVPELRVEVAGVAPSPTATPSAGSAAAAPALPAGARVVGVADDGSQIIYEGDAAAGKPATLDDEAAPGLSSGAAPGARAGAAPGSTARRARAEPPRTATRASRSTRPPTRERGLPADRGADRGGDPGNDYRAAVERVKAGDHAAGVAALRTFLARYPRHDFADNAQYWIGEAYYAQRDYPSALAEFRAVADTYPLGNKVPDALLKVGYCLQALGEKQKARAALEQLVTRYPKTEPAATAAKRLESP